MSTTIFPWALSVADVNRDGNLDLIFLGSDSSTNHAYVQLGDGKGRFQAPVSVATGYISEMQVADINGDGIPDLGLTSGSPGQQGNSWSVLLGHGDGTFASPVVVGSDTNTCTLLTPTGCQHPTLEFVLADVNGDHKPDLIFPLTFGTFTADGILAVELNATHTMLAITSSSLPAGVINKPYSQTLAASGGTSPYTWSLTSGSLPNGLTLSIGGAITGTPTAIGTSTFSVQVRDSAGAAVTQSFNLAITNGILTITTLSPLVPAAVGLAYSQTLGASGGVGPYSWVVTSGSTPSGLTLSAAGIISGTPSTAGNYGFTVRVTDSSGAAAFQAYTLNVVSVGLLTRSGALSHVAAGGGWTTVITLVNTSAASVAVTVGLHNDNGTPLNLAVTTTQQGVTQTVTTSSVTTVISPNATFLISTGDQIPSLAVGWADVSSSGPVNGFAIFRTVSSNSPASEGTVPLQSQFSSTITLPYDNTAGFVMGVALANLATTSANVTATIWDDSGNRLGTQTITIAGNGHTAFVLPNQLALTAGKRGIVQFQSSGGIAGLGLRFSPFGTFTSVPTM
jgi:hypothetical protein